MCRNSSSVRNTVQPDLRSGSRTNVDNLDNRGIPSRTGISNVEHKGNITGSLKKQFGRLHIQVISHKHFQGPSHGSIACENPFGEVLSSVLGWVSSREVSRIHFRKRAQKAS